MAIKEGSCIDMGTLGLVSLRALANLGDVVLHASCNHTIGLFQAKIQRCQPLEI